MNEIETTETETELRPESSFHSLDPRNIKLQTYINLIVTVVLFVGWLIGLLGTFVTAGLTWPFFAVAGAGVVLVPLLICYSFFWPRISYRNTKWRLGKKGLEIHRGVIWKMRISVPTARVQHADVMQGPFQRPFDLGTLTVHTAGTSNASVELEGLQHGVALQLRDQIVSQRKAIDVV